MDTEFAVCTLERCFWMQLRFCVTYSNHLQNPSSWGNLFWSVSSVAPVRSNTALWLKRLMKPRVEASIQLMTKTEDKQRRSCLHKATLTTAAAAHRDLISVQTQLVGDDITSVH